MNYATKMRLWLLLAVLAAAVPAQQPAPLITPPDDRCVTEPCVYHVRDRKLEVNTPFYIQLHNVDTADSTSCRVSKIRCEFDNMELGKSFVPDSGSLTNVSHYQSTYTAHTMISARDEKYYIVLLNEGQESMRVDVEVTFQVADCLLFLASLLFVPGLLLGICFCIFKAETRKAGHSPKISEEDLEARLCCCEYDVTKDPGPADPLSECCDCSCKLPRWSWCCGFPLDFWKKPNVSYSRWWRQQVLLTWPWNPEEDEGLTTLGARQTFTLTTLLFNLLVLTLWSEVLLQLNSSVSRVMPVLGSYFSRYVGSTVFQWLFYIIFKPLLTFLYFSGPNWQKAPGACKRFWGYIFTYCLQIMFLILLGAVAYSTLLLFTEFRCSVLLSGLIIPFFCYELLKMVLVMGFIPLPLWYWLLIALGPEVQPAVAQEEREPLRGRREEQPRGQGGRAVVV